MVSYKSIKYKSYRQEDYDKEIKEIEDDEYKHIRCTCGSLGHFHRHGAYWRFLTSEVEDIIKNNDEKKENNADDKNETNLIKITRIRCESCNKTHALLPTVIIPYRILSNPIITKMIDSYRNAFDSVAALARMAGISPEQARKLISFYEKHHKERLESFLADFNVAEYLDQEFISGYFKENHMMFMQRTATVNQIIYS